MPRARGVVAVLLRALLGVATGAAGAFLLALLRPQRQRPTSQYVAPVPPGELRV